MAAAYQPGWQSREYHRLTGEQRRAVRREVDRIFRERTGVTRRLQARGRQDRELRHTWLRIRDEVMGKREAALVDEEMELRAELEKDPEFVESIPEEMAGLGWKRGAALLETWFERPPAIAPSYSRPVTDRIDMDWVLSFARAKQVFDELVRDKIWTNAASQKRLKEIFKRRAVSGVNFGTAFGTFQQSVPQIDQDWVNVRPVRSLLALDAMTAALGQFSLHVAVRGNLFSTGFASIDLHVEEVAVYVKDSFDFNGSQFLGFWGPRDTAIYNVDFRDWRRAHNAGGDFEVFSDIKRVKLAKPDVVSVAL